MRMSDRLEEEHERENELELRLVVAQIQEALDPLECSKGMKWGAALTVAVVEYLRDHGYRACEPDEDDDDAVIALAGAMFSAARAAMRAQLDEARRRARIRESRGQR
jgi:hypothetical protein